MVANARIESFIKEHVVSDVPDDLADLFDHDEGIGGVTITILLMLLTINAVGWPVKFLFF